MFEEALAEVELITEKEEMQEEIRSLRKLFEVQETKAKEKVSNLETVHKG